MHDIHSVVFTGRCTTPEIDAASEINKQRLSQLIGWLVCGEIQPFSKPLLSLSVYLVSEWKNVSFRQ
jgi:hypothetical protein